MRNIVKLINGFLLGAHLCLSATIKVEVGVGENPLTFSPDNVVAAEGDIIQFVFDGSPGQHSVVQSDFENPCQPLDGGFNSGFVDVAAGFSGPFQVYELQVKNASAPIWFYCAQITPEPHCPGGMSGVINQGSGGNTIDDYQIAARNLESFPAQTPSLGPTGGVGAVGLAAPTVSGAVPPPSSTSSTSTSGSSTSSTSSTSSQSTSSTSGTTSSSSSSTTTSSSSGTNTVPTLTSTQTTSTHSPTQTSAGRKSVSYPNGQTLLVIGILAVVSF